MTLLELIPEQIWLYPYPVRYAGLTFDARMTVMRLADGRLLLHSPAPINAELQQAIAALGPVAYLVAPGTYHYLHLPAAQQAFPNAETYICPGIERKCPELAFDWILGDRPPAAWSQELDQVLVRGNRLIWEVAFFHRASRTLLLVDLVENIGDRTVGVSWGLKVWWQVAFRMWNRPKPAPEYQLGWQRGEQHRQATRRSLECILDWDFERVILAHGDLIETNAQAALRQAWQDLLAPPTFSNRPWTAGYAKFLALVLLYGATVHLGNMAGFTGTPWLTTPLLWRGMDVVLLGFDLVAAIALWRGWRWSMKLIFGGMIGLQFLPYTVWRSQFVLQAGDAQILNGLLGTEAILLVIFALLLRFEK